MNKIYISLLLIGISACDSLRKEVDFESDQYPTSLVISAFPTIGDSLNSSISLSKGTLDAISSFDNVTNAKFKLFENGNLIQELNGANVNENYLFNEDLSSNNFYQIEVSHPDFRTISAETFVPVPVQNLTAIGTVDNDELTIEISFDDSPNAEFYRLVIMEQDFITGWETNSQYFDIDPFEGTSYYYRDGFFTDEGFRDGRASLDVDLSYFSGNGELKVVLIACSEDYFNYFKSRFAWEESDGAGPFTEPVQIYTNVTNGLGILAGYSITEAAVEL
ncbi:MAG: DUF4249 domain-containing protein [Bacteroidota bacterium]